MTPRPVDHLSPSGLSRWRQCPRSWKHRYVDKIPDPPQRAGIMGTFIHRTLELLYEQPAAERTNERTRGLARKAWDETELTDGYKALCLSPDAAFAMRSEAWTAIANLWKIEEPTQINVVATEMKVSVDLAGVPFTGIIDRVGPYNIIDYKSGSVPSERHLDFTQLILYAAAIRAINGKLPELAVYFWLKEGTTANIWVTEKDADRAEQEMAADWQRIGAACETDAFTAQTSPLCLWCPFIDRCAEGSKYGTQRIKEGKVRIDAPARRFLEGSTP